MKKLGFLIGAALLTLGSCTNEFNEEGFVDKANTISFSAYSKKTRAVGGDVTSDNMNGDNFGVVGYKSDNSIYLYKGTNSAVEQTWNNTSRTWEYLTPGDLKFWPDGVMDFYAYFPYSDDATFAESDASGDVMTIPNVNCSHDVLFAKQTTSYIARVPLTFHHAFSKIKGVNVSIEDNGYVKDAGVSVEIQKVEFINTSTSGAVKVDNSGVASYKAASPNVTLSKDLSSAVVTVNSSHLTGTLIDNSASGGYLFATTSNSTATNNVKGTGKTMWDGTTTSWAAAGKTLENLGRVCLKLTCKVWNGTEDKKYYYVGDNSDYGVMYIPLNGSIDASSNTVSTFEAGKRYTYNIVFKDNVGFRDNGNPVLRPILFKVESVDAWGDVNVTITL